MSACFDLPNALAPEWVQNIPVSNYTLDDEASMKLPTNDLKIAFFGTGAIGASVGGWVNLSTKKPIFSTRVKLSMRSRPAA
jgi:hypothetical protein